MIVELPGGDLLVVLVPRLGRAHGRRRGRSAARGCRKGIDALERAVRHGRYARLSGYERDHVPRSAEAAVAAVADDSGERMAHRADEIQDLVGLPAATARRAGTSNDVLHVTPGDEFATHGQRRSGSAARGRVRRIRSGRAYRRTAEEGCRRQADAPARLDDARASVRARRHAADRAALFRRLQLLADGDQDDWGATWKTSTPLVGPGNIQPSLARKKDGTLVAYMRDNGPAPKRLMISRSTDRGETWSRVEDTDLPNPGSGAEVLALDERPLGADLQRPGAGAVQPGGLDVRRRRADVAVDAAPRTRSPTRPTRSSAASTITRRSSRPPTARCTRATAISCRAASVTPDAQERAAAQDDQARALQRGVGERASIASASSWTTWGHFAIE